MTMNMAGIVVIAPVLLQKRPLIGDVSATAEGC